MNSSYKHILLATDLLHETAAVNAKAKELANLYQARLSAIHVVESVPLYFGNELVLPETQEIERQLLDRARQKMNGLAVALGMDQSLAYVELGVTKLAIIDFVKQHQVDLIVLGSHGRHGLEHLLGSTARALVNAAPCDVLAVRIPQQTQ